MEKVSKKTFTINPGGRKPSCTPKIIRTLRRTTWNFTPVLAPLLEDGLLCAVLGGMLLLQTLMTAAGLSIWECPLDSVFDLPCPGCGLSRATSALLKGRWLAAIHIHPMAPIVAAGGVAVIVIRLQRARVRKRIIFVVGELEKKAGVPLMLVTGFLISWWIRLTTF